MCVVENEGVRTHGYGLAMLGLIVPVGLARADVYDGGDVSDPPPTRPVKQRAEVWANVCDPLVRECV